MNNSPQDSYHGSSGSPPMDVASPSLAERARTLMVGGGHSGLATVSLKHDGYPFASVMPYAVDTLGRPAFLISQMAMHTKNVRVNPRATLLVAEHSASPLGAARISVMGDIREITGAERELVAEIYLARHAESRQWSNFGDFGYYQMAVKDVYFVGGFGVMGWVTPEDYAAAEPDPLLNAASDILAHMNEDHVESMELLLKTQLECEGSEVKMTAIDRYGFDLLFHTNQGFRGGRIAFVDEVTTPQECREMLVEMVRAAHNRPPTSA